MIYPLPIKQGDTIGITAPSDGITETLEINRLDNAIRNFKLIGYNIKETTNVRMSHIGRSSSAKQRAIQFENLLQDESVSFIITATGGDFLLEMLSQIDVEVIKNNPKWIQGYSDPTSLLFYITTKLDIATIYANNFKTFGMEKWHKSLEDNLKILNGNNIEQKSFDKYEQKELEKVIGNEGYNLDSDVYWKIISKENSIDITGRLIGGCLDCLSDCIFGTKFDNTVNFIEKYKADGIIWYFDNCELTSEQLVRAMWKFKNAGWFKYAKCIVFGRPLFEKSCYNVSYEQAIQTSLKELNIPIIINADVGHVSPRMTFINGGIAQLHCKDGKAKINFKKE